MLLETGPVHLWHAAVSSHPPCGSLENRRDIRHSLPRQVKTTVPRNGPNPGVAALPGHMTRRKRDHGSEVVVDSRQAKEQACSTEIPTTASLDESTFGLLSSTRSPCRSTPAETSSVSRRPSIRSRQSPIRLTLRSMVSRPPPRSLLLRPRYARRRDTTASCRERQGCQLRISHGRGCGPSLSWRGNVLGNLARNVARTVPRGKRSQTEQIRWPCRQNMRTTCSID